MTGFSRDYRGKCTDGAALWGRFVADKRSGCVLDGDLEGIVSKRLGSRYVSGRTTCMADPVLQKAAPTG
jgi:hypothetical protein